MKTSIKLLITALVYCYSGFSASAQTPQRMNYQAVARTDAGVVLVSQNIEVRFSIHTNTENGTIVYSEEHLVTTNPFGVFTSIIGEGVNPFGDFATIDWGGANKFLQVEMDPDGNGWINMGTTELLSVPYALHSANGGVTYVAGEGITITGTTISNNITTLDALMDVNTTGAAAGQVLKWNGSAWVADNDIGGGNGDNWGTQSVATDATLSGNGVLGNELELAQQGATNGQTLKWNGTSWVPANDIDTDTNTDAQTLTLVGSNLSISGGNSVTLPAGTAYTAGTGISIAGSTITNTGDTDATNDLTNTSTASGDVTGTFSNLQIAANAVGSAEIADNAIGATELASTSVVAGTYGSATQSPQFTVDADGRITAVANQTIAGGGGGGNTTSDGEPSWSARFDATNSIVEGKIFDDGTDLYSDHGFMGLHKPGGTQYEGANINVDGNGVLSIGMGDVNPTFSGNKISIDTPGNIAINDNELRLRAVDDSYHVLKFDNSANGPRLAGWSGGVLGATANSQTIDVLQWNDAGNVGIGGWPEAKLDVKNGHVALNDSALYLRAGNEAFHYIGFAPDINAPRIAGWNGGALGTTEPGFEADALRWDQGRVGIGTNTSPDAQLTVIGIGDYDGQHIAHFESYGTNADGILIKLNGPLVTTKENNFLTFKGGNNIVAGRIEGFSGSGDWTAPPSLSFPNISCTSGVTYNSGWFNPGVLPSITLGDLDVNADNSDFCIDINPLPGPGEVDTWCYPEGFSFSGNLGGTTGCLPSLNSAPVTLGLPGCTLTGVLTAEQEAFFCWALDKGIQGTADLNPQTVAINNLEFQAYQACNTGGVTYGSRGADYAEYLPKADTSEYLQAFDVVGVKGGKVTRNTEGAEQIMVVSSKPVVLGNTPAEGTEDEYVVCGFMGQLPVVVRGTCTKGDFIIASGLNDGTAVAVSPENIKLEQLDQVVGRAWEDQTNPIYGLVNVAIGLKTNEWIEILKTQQQQIEQLSEKLNSTDQAVSEIDALKADLELIKTAIGIVPGTSITAEKNCTGTKP
ncbi:MAG: hypothetical protein ACKVOK_00130 [Flavobacteriales bacterium]